MSLWPFTPRDTRRLNREIEELKSDVQFWSSRCIARVQECADLRRQLCELRAERDAALAAVPARGAHGRWARRNG